MGTHVPGFQSFYGPFASFYLCQISHQKHFKGLTITHKSANNLKIFNPFWPRDLLE